MSASGGLAESATVAHASAPHLVYFETQEGALCGKHVLNNLKEGPYVTCEACGLAARQVVQHLSQVLGEQPFALFAFPTDASPAMASPLFPAGFPTEVLVRIMSYAFGPYREGRVVEQCWATDGPDCRGVQAKTVLPVGSIVKLQRSVMCDIGFLRALCLYDDENGNEKTGWITVETKNNFTVYVKQILSVPLSNFVRAQTNPFPKIHRAREFNGGNSSTGRKKRKAGKQGGELSSSDTTTGRKKCNAGDLSSGICVT